jgi:hypothetical protein
MAVTANQIIYWQDGDRQSGPVMETTHLYEGTLAFFNATGYVVGIVAGGANPFAGVLIKEYDNSSGATGAITAEFNTEGDYVLTGAGFSQATVGLDIFASDNYTVTTSNSATSYVGRCVGYISSTQIIVSLKKTGPVDVLAAAATGTTAATFTVDSDLGKPRTALASQTGGTGNFTAFIKPPATLGADRVFTLVGDADASLVNVAGAQTLTSKTLTAPILNAPVIVQTHEAHTAGDTLLAAESGSVHTNTGAGGTITIVLPAATVGLVFDFHVGAVQELRIDPNGVETIGLPSTGAQGAGGKYLVADAVGEWVRLKCVIAGTWTAEGYFGTWAAEG